MSVLSDSGKRKFSCICFMTQQARAPPHTVESKEVSAEKKNIKRELTFIFTAILHSWTRIPQVFFWIITNCITDVNLPWQQLNRCKVWYYFYATTLLCTFVMYEYKQKRNQTSEPTQYSMTTLVSKWSLSIV